MQKNKKLLYILIPGTLLLWGIIIYKIFNTVNRKDNNDGWKQSSISTAGGNENVADTFSINENYRDPFKMEAVKLKRDNTSTALPVRPSTNPSTVKPVVSSGWPSIIYNGMIKNQKSNKQLILVQINGKTATMRSGDVLDGVEVTKIFRDSIEVKFGKEKKFVSK